MAFVRFGCDSDIYAYPCGNGTVQIHVNDGSDFTAHTDEEFTAIVKSLSDEGFVVPEFLLTLKPFETERAKS